MDTATAHNAARRGLWIVCLIVLVVASSYDAVREIPPLADDLWAIEKGPGQLIAGLTEYGWTARVLGVCYLDLTNSVARWTGAPTLAVVLLNRVLSLLCIYICLRLVFRYSSFVSSAAVLLFALAPPAHEGWTMLCTGHLAMSVPLLVLSCGLFARALQTASESGRVPWKLLAGAGLAEVATLAFYEQAIFAIPVFVGILLIHALAVDRVAIGAAARIGLFAAGGSIVWLGAMLGSGYVAARTAPQSGVGVEPADLVVAAQRLWTGFVQHHLWRVVEILRTGRVWVWDTTVVGVVGMLATVVLAVVVAVRFNRSEAGRDSSVEEDANGLPASPVLLAAVPAAYAAILPLGFAYPGFAFYSRMYYVPAFFVALGLAVLLGVLAKRWRWQAVLLLAVAVLWCGVLSRRYLNDMRDGAWLVRDVANAVADVPSQRVAEGVLVVAPDNVGTFSTSAVQSWSLRSAIRLYRNVDVAGPLYFSTTLEAGAATAIVDERSQPSEVRHWGAIVESRPDGITTATSLESASTRPRSANADTPDEH